MATPEQAEEIEVLLSIYPEELQLLTPTSFRIKLLLDPPPTDTNLPPTVVLHTSFPATYPEVTPDLDVTLESSGPASPWLTFPEDKETLLAALNEAANENMGMAMVFALASTLKEAAEGLMNERVLQKQQERDAEARQEEEKEMEKFRGELVTRERFVEWRRQFMQEKEDARRKISEDEEAEGKRGQKANVKEVEKKLTGRELWERGLVGAIDDEEGDDDEGNVMDLQKLKLSC